MIEIASKILESDPAPEKESMRMWAIEVINKHSSVPISEDLNKEFLSFRLPSVLNTGERYLDDRSNPISYAASKGADVFRQNMILAGEDEKIKDIAISRAEKLLRTIIEENTERKVNSSVSEDLIKHASPHLKLLIKIGFADSYRKSLEKLYSVYSLSENTEDAAVSLARLNRGIEHTEYAHSILMRIFEEGTEDNLTNQERGTP